MLFSAYYDIWTKAGLNGYKEIYGFIHYEILQIWKRKEIERNHKFLCHRPAFVKKSFSFSGKMIYGMTNLAPFWKLPSREHYLTTITDSSLSHYCSYAAAKIVKIHIDN